MEVIIVASAVSQLALRSLDKYAGTLALSSPSDNGNERTTSRAAASGLSQPTKDGDVEGSISSLEAKLGQLKSQAKALNSPETFVQYALVSREANKVERELNARRAVENEGVATTGVDIEGVAKFFSRTVGHSTAGLLNRQFWLSMIKLFVRIVVFLALWFYFSWYLTSEEDHESGNAIAVDCLAMRPLAFLLAKRPSCFEEDWTCSANLSECTIPISVAFGMCNIVLAMVLKIFT